MITKNCKQCNKEFTDKPSHIANRVYCSKKCNNESKLGVSSWNKGLSTKVKVNCSYCNNEFLVQKKRIEKQDNFFCNIIHKGLFYSGARNPKYVENKLKCIDCGSVIKYYNKHDRCKSCANKYWRGENHFNYKDGSSKNAKRQYSYDYKLWRMSVFERDWFTCQYPGCGYKGKDIQCHHIKMVKNNPELLLDIDNGITLCKTCHNKTRCKEEYYEKLFTLIVNIWKN